MMKYKVKAYLKGQLDKLPVVVHIADKDDVAKNYALQIANDLAGRGLYDRVLIDGYVHGNLIPSARISVYN